MFFYLLKKVSEKCVVIKLNPYLTSEIMINILNTPGLKGVVLETYGFGKITLTNVKFIKIIEEAIQKKSKNSLKFTKNLQKLQINQKQ